MEMLVHNVFFVLIVVARMLHLTMRYMLGIPLTFTQVGTVEGNPYGEVLSIDANAVLLECDACYLNDRISEKLTTHVILHGLQGRVNAYRVLRVNPAGYISVVIEIQPCWIKQK